MVKDRQVNRLWQALASCGTIWERALAEAHRAALRPGVDVAAARAATKESREVDGATESHRKLKEAKKAVTNHAHSKHEPSNHGRCRTA